MKNMCKNLDYNIEGRRELSEAKPACNIPCVATVVL